MSYVPLAPKKRVESSAATPRATIIDWPLQNGLRALCDPPIPVLASVTPVTRPGSQPQMPKLDELPVEIAALVASFLEPQPCYAGPLLLRHLLALRCASRSCKDAVRRAPQCREKDNHYYLGGSSESIAAMGRVFGGGCRSLAFGGLKSEECVSALQSFVTRTKGQLRYLNYVGPVAHLCPMSALLEMCRASPLLTDLRVHGSPGSIISAANLDDFASAVSIACPLLETVWLQRPRSPAEDYLWRFPRAKSIDLSRYLSDSGGPICYDNVELTLRSCVNAVEIEFAEITVTSQLVDLIVAAPVASRLKSLNFSDDAMCSPELILRLAGGLEALSDLQFPYYFDGGSQFFRSLVLARPGIVNLNLAFCCIDHEGLKIICEGLRLEHLDLSYRKDNGTFPPSAVDIRLAGPFAVEAIVESPSAQTLRSIDITHLPFLPEEMLQLLRGCPKLAKLEWDNPDGYFFDNSFSPIQDGPAVDALNALLKSRGCRPIDFYDDDGSLVTSLVT